jgi:ATP-dependent helicase IRC3
MHIASIIKLFEENGINVQGIDGQTEASERQEIINDFACQRFPVLVNCGIVTEGVDIPAIDSIILARPTRSGVLLQQMVGRGMRLHPSNLILINR